jgi:DNA-binding Lrp family transcriptional regulator
MIRYRLFNPGQLSDDDLVAGFVARHRELDELLGIIRHQPESGPLQHVLMIGERGMGKTMLGLRTMIAVRRDPDLTGLWQPVPFGEESYRVTSLGKLWLEALGQLSAATGDARWIGEADALRRGEKDDARMAARARALLTEFRTETGRRPILLVENLDEMLGQLSDTRDVARLRADLQTSDDFMLLATATRRFAAVTDYSQPFYQFFRLMDLRGLDRAATMGVVDSIAESLDCAGLRQNERANSGRVETIRTLTGGNPRLIHLTARMVAQAPHGSAMSDLEQLIDEQTPYFKARVDALPPQQREIVQTLATLWVPATAATLGEAVRLGTSQISAQLKKLEKDGFVRRLDVPGSKRSHYEVSARLYTLYFVMRFTRGERERLEHLVEFLTTLYGLPAATSMLDAAMRRLADPECQTRWADGIIVEKLSPMVESAREDIRQVIARTTRLIHLSKTDAIKDNIIDVENDYMAVRDIARIYPDKNELRLIQAGIATSLILAYGMTGKLDAAAIYYTELCKVADAHSCDVKIREAKFSAILRLAILCIQFGRIDEAEIYAKNGMLHGHRELRISMTIILSFVEFWRQNYVSVVAYMDDLVACAVGEATILSMTFVTLAAFAPIWILYAARRPSGVVLGALERLGIADRLEPLYRVLQEEAGVVLPPLPQEVRLAMDDVRDRLTALRSGVDPADVLSR